MIIEEKEDKKNKQLQRKSKGRWKLKINPFLNPYPILCYKNWAYINQEIIKNPDSDQGFWSDISYYKKISRVQKIKSFYNFNLSQRIQANMPIEYLVERLISTGNAKVKLVSQKIIELNQILQQNKDEFKKGNFGALQNYLQYFDDQKVLINYCACNQNGIDIKNVVISKPLLDFLGFEDNEMALKCMKLDMILLQTIDPKSYLDIILGYLDCCINYFKNFSADNIENNPFKGLTMKIVNRLVNNKNQYVFCNTILYFPHPTLICFVVEDQIKKVNIDAPPEPLKLAWKTLEQMKIKQKESLKSIGAHKEQSRVRASFRQVNSNSVINSTQKSHEKQLNFTQEQKLISDQNKMISQ